MPDRLSTDTTPVESIALMMSYTSTEMVKQQRKSRKLIFFTMIFIEYIMMSVKPRNTGRRFICTLSAYVERHMLDIQTTFYLEIAINNTQITHPLGINTTYVCS